MRYRTVLPLVRRVLLMCSNHVELGDDAHAGQRAAHGGERESHGEVGELGAGQRAAHPGAGRRFSGALALTKRRCGS